MKRKRMPHSIRKHIRRKKALIRRKTLDIKKQRELIDKLYNENKRDSKTSN